MNTDPPHENDQTHPTGGATKPQGDGALDLDVSPLKSSTTVSITEKTLVAVGDCFVKFPPHAFREETTVELSYVPHLGPGPEGYTPVTSVLSCDPSFQGNKNVKVKLPTFCSTEKEVEAGIFTKDQEGSWKEIERRRFTQENYLELHYLDLGKLAAFVKTDRLGDVYFNISCFLYNETDGKFTMAICLKDKAIENVLLHKLRNKKYFLTIAEIEPLLALLGDEILCKITHGQQTQSTKFVVDEKFVLLHQAHVFCCTINIDAVNPQYFITHKRQGRVVKEKAYGIYRRDPVKEVETDRILKQGNKCQKSGIESDSTPVMDENQIDNKAKPKRRSQMPSTSSESSDRLEDAYIEIIKRLYSMQEFLLFARSKQGLKLSTVALTPILLSPPFDVTEQKWKILSLWERNENATTPAQIWERVNNYFKKKNTPKLVQKQESTQGYQGQNVNSSRREKRGNTSVVFHGDVEAKTVITGAKNVRIDQRQMRGKKPQRGDKTVIERVVDAEQEEGATTEEKPGSAGGVAEEHSEQPAPDIRAELFPTDFEKKPEIPGVVAEQHYEQPIVDDKAVPIYEEDENDEGVAVEQQRQGTAAGPRRRGREGRVEVVEEDFGNEIVTSRSTVQKIGPNGGRVEIGSCVIIFHENSFEKITLVKAKAEIDHRKWPSQYDVVSPMLYVDAKALIIPASLEITSWCVGSEDEDGDDIADVLHQPDGSHDWRVIHSLPFNEDAVFKFDCLDFSPLFISLRRRKTSKYLFDSYIFANVRNNFRIVFSLRSKMASEEIEKKAEQMGYKCEIDFNSISAKLGDEIVLRVSCLRPQGFCFAQGEFPFSIDKNLKKMAPRRFHSAMKSDNKHPTLVTIEGRMCKNDRLADGPHCINYQWEVRSETSKSTENCGSNSSTMDGQSSQSSKDEESSLEPSTEAVERLNIQDDQKKEVKDLKSKMEPSTKTQKHVMLSYQWDSQKTMLRLYKYLTGKGLRVWIDIHNMTGNMNKAMAEAVEGALIIVMGITNKFQKSENCEKEVSYADKRKVKMLPLKLEPEYPTDGWLGFIVGPLLYVDLATGKEISRFEEILTQIKKLVPDWAESLVKTSSI